MNLEEEMLKPYINKIIRHENLTAQEAEEAMTIILSGKATSAQIGGYLVALRMKGETVEEVVGSVRAMRDHANRVLSLRKKMF
jgi:anthranilate phosphoribosyltransferase